jgi:hypothetical protein
MLLEMVVTGKKATAKHKNPRGSVHAALEHRVSWKRKMKMYLWRETRSMPVLRIERETGGMVDLSLLKIAPLRGAIT